MTQKKTKQKKKRKNFSEKIEADMNYDMLLAQVMEENQLRSWRSSLEHLVPFLPLHWQPPGKQSLGL